MNKVALLALLLAMVCVPATAQEDGIENLRETGLASSSVASAVPPSVVYIQAKKKRNSILRESCESR